MIVCTRFAASSGLQGTSAGYRPLGLVVVLALCLGGAFLVRPVPAMAADCEMTVKQNWLGDLVATAVASGACGMANIELVVRNGVDEVVWSMSHQSDHMMGFDDIVGPDALRMALGDWLGAYADAGSTDRLPEWPQGADQPDSGEFAFYVAEGLSQQDYEALRTGGYPMICYIQGRESALCLVRHPDASALINVGVQSFPG